MLWPPLQRNIFANPTDSSSIFTFLSAVGQISVYVVWLCPLKLQILIIQLNPSYLWITSQLHRLWCLCKGFFIKVIKSKLWRYFDNTIRSYFRRKPQEEERRVEKLEENSAPTKRWPLITMRRVSCQNLEEYKFWQWNTWWWRKNISAGSIHLEADRTISALNQLHTGHYNASLSLSLLQTNIIWFWFRLLTWKRSPGKRRSIKQRAKVLARNCEKKIGWREQLLRKTKF